MESISNLDWDFPSLGFVIVGITSGSVGDFATPDYNGLALSTATP